MAIVLVVFFHNADQHNVGNHDVADVSISLGGKLVREHCTTCHIDGARPDPNPNHLSHTTKPHPDILPHRIDQLGCTGCHLGEGMALDVKISHGLPGLDARKVLSGEDMQSSCFVCHTPGPLPGAEKAWRGYQLFFTNACNTCHTISQEDASGFYGPDLKQVGSVLGLDQIQEAIREPRKKPANSKMPRFPLSKRQSREISYFLKSLTGEPLYATHMQLQAGMVKTIEVDLIPKGSDFSEGEGLLCRRQCLACHKFGEKDGRVGPDLSYIGEQRQAVYLKSFLNNPTLLIPGAAMPRIHMDAATETTLVQFLLNDATGPVPTPLVAGSSAMQGQTLAEPSSGKQLYMQLCQRCHAAEGNGRGPIQPNLANFPRAFLDNAEFFRSVSDKRLQESLRNGVPGTSMPGYSNLLTQQQIDQLLDLVFSAFIAIDRQDKEILNPLSTLPDSSVSAQRVDELFVENCQRCHGAFGTGTGSEYLDHLPRPRNLRNEPYFKALTDKRIFAAIYNGIPGTAMPAFRDHLEGREIWGLAEKVIEFTDKQVSE